MLVLSPQGSAIRARTPFYTPWYHQGVSPPSWLVPVRFTIASLAWPGLAGLHDISSKLANKKASPRQEK